MTGTGMILTPEQMHKLKYLCDVSVPLLSTDWQGTAAPYTIQVDWPGMTDRDMPEIWLVPSGDTPTDAELAAAALITPSTQNGHLLFSASAKPATSITARVTGVPISGEFTAANMASLVAKVDQLNTGLAGSLLANFNGSTSAQNITLNDDYTNYKRLIFIVNNYQSVSYDLYFDRTVMSLTVPYRDDNGTLYPYAIDVKINNTKSFNITCNRSWGSISIYGELLIQ